MLALTLGPGFELAAGILCGIIVMGKLMELWELIMYQQHREKERKNRKSLLGKKGGG
jgi:hypothetical protein